MEEKFEVQTPVISKDKQWISDISEVLVCIIPSHLLIIILKIILTNQENIQAVTRLFNLTKKQIGLIDLAADLDIETVTEIFIRINSKGVVLSQADFAMSKIVSMTLMMVKH